MPPPSAINIPTDLSLALRSTELDGVRFIITAIDLQKEEVVLLERVPINGFLADDLATLAKSDVLESDAVPRHIFTRQDSDGGWVLVSYVPDNVRSRDSFPHATSQLALKKAFQDGGNSLEGSPLEISNTSELTPETISEHIRNIDAPKLLSEREIEMQKVKASERITYDGARTRMEGLGARVDAHDGLEWSKAVKEGVGKLTPGMLLILAIDKPEDTSQTETVKLLDESKPLPIKCAPGQITSKVTEALKAKASKPDLYYAIYVREDLPGTKKFISILIGTSTSATVRFHYTWLLPPVENFVSTTLGIPKERRLEVDDLDELDREIALLPSSASSPGDASPAPEARQAFARPRAAARRK
ncbi:hypothetical protein BOTBODRAFT_35146 [Botryobasidium botryosum FD-172 SS1]|uniref:ADF-H domain-containing protein n=1 Tax=Botryobasidium botryosum (strain FD-172 SS1) TaxID=930990 RepID=A0A067M7G2_BOTB1|nr:hypothetical protein BOTBODRAFT_35146 [Botryobasidium botryosum FD-172 SS1]